MSTKQIICTEIKKTFIHSSSSTDCFVHSSIRSRQRNRQRRIIPVTALLLWKITPRLQLENLGKYNKMAINHSIFI